MSLENLAKFMSTRARLEDFHFYASPPPQSTVEAVVLRSSFWTPQPQLMKPVAAV